MTLSLLTNEQDVSAQLLRSLTATEEDYISALIIQASSLLRTSIPAIDDLIARNDADPTDLGSVSSETVSTVLAGVVKRCIVNPEGLTTLTQELDTARITRGYAQRGDVITVRGILEITADDLAQLFPTRKRLRVGSIRLRASLAPRPVGRYGGYPDIGTAVAAVITFSPDLDLTCEPLLGPYCA